MIEAKKSRKENVQEWVEKVKLIDAIKHKLSLLIKKKVKNTLGAKTTC